MIWILISTILVTSFISGILGMAGGMILIGVLSLLLPITTAMILHGITQLGSNGYRAYLLNKHIKIRILPSYILGSTLGLLIFTFLNFVPSKGFVLIAVGMFPFFSIYVLNSVQIDVMKSKNSFICGVVVTTFQILAGASGPLLDIFFIKSSLNRYEIIATKAITQTIGHLIKLFYYGQILFYSPDEKLEIPYLHFAVAVACALIGTKLGRITLGKLTELQFQNYSRVAITFIGAFFIVKGLLLTF